MSHSGEMWLSSHAERVLKVTKERQEISKNDIDIFYRMWYNVHEVKERQRSIHLSPFHLVRGYTYTTEYKWHGTACQKSAVETRTGEAMTTDSNGKRGRRAEGSRKRKRASARRTDTEKRSVPVYMNCDCKKNRKIRKYFLTFNRFCAIIQVQSNKGWAVTAT